MHVISFLIIRNEKKGESFLGIVQPVRFFSKGKNGIIFAAWISNRRKNGLRSSAEAVGIDF